MRCREIPVSIASARATTRSSSLPSPMARSGPAAACAAWCAGGSTGVDDLAFPSPRMRREGGEVGEGRRSKKEPA